MSVLPHCGQVASFFVPTVRTPNKRPNSGDKHTNKVGQEASNEDSTNDLTVDVGQATMQAIVVECQPLVIDAQ